MTGDRVPTTSSVMFVLGLPHAGAPALARALVEAGAVLAPDASHDPEDFAASRAIALLNADMLNSVGIDLANPGPLTVSGKTLAAVRAELTADYVADRGDRAAALLAKATTPGATTVISDPQIMLLLPFWRRIAADAGIDARVVHVHRNPLALADLARQRSQQPVRRGWFVWQCLTVETLEAAPEAIVVTAADLARDPAAVARSLLPAATSVTGSVEPPLATHPNDEDALEEAPLFPDQGRRLHALLERWPGMALDDRASEVADLRARFDDAMLVAALGRAPRLKKGARPAAEMIVSTAPEDPAGPVRPLILHFHLFKNAGSSIDAMLKKNFGERWTEHEFPRKGRDSNGSAVTAFLQDHDGIDAFSSHTMLLPVPKVRGRSIIPIIFVRHPLLRMRSAYGFERRQDAETTGAKLAKAHDFAGYVAALLKEPRNRQARNFQTVRFAFGTRGDPAHEFERAMATLDSLPFVGLVERYDRSVARLCALVRPAFPDFEPLIVRRNAEQPADNGTIEDRIARIRDELGPEMYATLVEANRDDIRLFEHVCTLYSDPLD